MEDREQTGGQQDEPLREEDVTAGDRLDDRVQEGDGLPERDDDPPAAA